MGAAVGAVLRAQGHRVLWASEERSDETLRRAEAAGLEDVGSVSEVARAEVVFSICPPHAALEVARRLEGFDGLYVDANAVAPATAARVASLVRRFVDGGFVGRPPPGARAPPRAGPDRPACISPATRRPPWPSSSQARCSMRVWC